MTSETKPKLEWGGDQVHGQPLETSVEGWGRSDPGKEPNLPTSRSKGRENATPVTGSYLEAEARAEAVDKDKAWLVQAATYGMSMTMEDQKAAFEAATARQKEAAERAGPGKVEKGTPSGRWLIVCGSCTTRTRWPGNVKEPPSCVGCGRLLWDPALFKAARFVFRTFEDAGTFNEMLRGSR